MQAQEGSIYFTELAERVEYGNYNNSNGNDKQIIVIIVIVTIIVIRLLIIIMIIIIIIVVVVVVILGSSQVTLCSQAAEKKPGEQTDVKCILHLWWGPR